MLAQYKADIIIISLKIILFSPRYSWKIAELALNVQQSFTPLYRLSFNLWFMITPLVLTPFLQARHYYWVHYQPQEEAEGVITTFHPLHIMNAWISVGTLLYVWYFLFMILEYLEIDIMNSQSVGIPMGTDCALLHMNHNSCMGF